MTIPPPAANSPHRLATEGILIGTASWTDPTLVETDSFYPSTEMTPDARLRFYAEQFPLVEIDSTYYGPPNQKTAALWAARTPPHFRFDVKAYRLLTQHPTPPASLWKDLRTSLPEELAAKPNLYARDLPTELLDEAFRRFGEGLQPLQQAGKLGILLFQLPPYVFPSRPTFSYLAKAAERLAGFSLGVEFRNSRFLDDQHRETTLGFLGEHRLSYICVDEPQGFRSSVPPIAATTGPIAEVRFHGRNALTWEARGLTPAERFRHEYSASELAEWVPKIRALGEDAHEVHLVFNNCYGDLGIRGGRLLADLLAERQ